MSDPLAPYAELYAKPAQGPGDHRPTTHQVIQDFASPEKLKGKTVLVTGGSSGLGLETAKALFTAGADVYITARDANKGQHAVEDIYKAGGQGKVEFIEMEMNSLESVKKAAQDFLAKSKSKSLNILVCNAGIMAVPNRTETKDGFESQFGVNYLAHYVLTALLIPTLLSSSTPDCNSRLISVTSSGHGFSPVRFQDTYLKNDYDPWIAYGQSKTGNIWMANYIDRKYGPLGLHANSVHPGVVATGIAQNLSPEAAGSLAENSVLARQMKTPAQGAATAVWAAVADALEGLGGEFLVDCGLGVPAENAGDIADEGFASHAFDREGEDRLWELSKELTRVDVEA